MRILHQRGTILVSLRVLILFGALYFLGTAHQSVFAATFTVTNTNNSGAGSLRQAITDAETAAGADNITFNIAGAGPHIISPTTALPNMAQQISIDGCTEPEANCSVFPAQPSVQINFSGLPANVNGFGFFDTADNSTIRGLSIVGNNAGVLNNAIGINDADNILIEQNLIGLTTTGAASANRYGIIAYGTDNLRLGTAGKGNVISGNITAGLVTDPTPADAATNITNFSMKGNWMGLGLDGTTARPNTGAPAPGTTVAGIYLGNGDSNSGAVIGGTTAAERNVFAASGRASLELAPFSGVSIRGNYFETTADGMQTISTGLSLFGTTSGHISVAFNPGTQNNVDIRDNIFGNVGVGSTFYSVGVGSNPASITNGLVIQHNQFGIASDGTSTLRSNDSDLAHGISLFQTPGAIVGGPNAADRNYFSNTGAAVYSTTAGGIRTENNYINFDTNGTPLSAPMTVGVFIATGNNHQIINNKSGYVAIGIRLSNTGFTSPTNTVIQGNYIGTTVNGMASATPIANSYGILMVGDDTVVGGTTTAQRNVIAGNAVGIRFGGNRTTILGNYIGVGADGTTPILTGNTGIWTSAATVARIGGTAPGEGNIIANSVYGGVLVEDTTGHAERVAIRGNSIYNNGALGINLEGTSLTFNPTPNDEGDGDTGGNNLQNFPVINRVERCDGTTQLRGSLSSQANRQYIIDFYNTPEGFSNPNYPDEGRTHVGSTTVTTDGSGNTTFALPSGASNLSMTATDPSGNTSEFGNIRDVAIKNCHVTEQFTKDHTPALGGTISIAGITNPVVQITVDGQTVNATYNDTTKTWSVADNTLTTIPDGTYDVTIQVTDPVSGITSTYTQPSALHISSTAPEVGLTPKVTKDTTPSMQGTIEDPNATVVLTINGKNYTATNNGDGTWTLPDGVVGPLTPGKYDVVVTVTDSDGDVSRVTFIGGLTIIGDPAAPTAPDTGMFAPVNLAYLTVVAILVLALFVGTRLYLRFNK